MTVTLVGSAPSLVDGQSFTCNARSWHSLWLYCDSRHSDITDYATYAYSGWGVGLDADKSLLLAGRLLCDIDTGAVEDYIAARNLIVSAIPDVPCEHCDGTGVRTDEVGVNMGMPDLALDDDVAKELGRARGWCNGCYGEGNMSTWEQRGALTLAYVLALSRFLAHCGGFDFDS